MKKLILFLWFLIPSIGWTLTLGNIQADVRRYVDDIADPKIRYSNDYLNDLINEVQRDIVNQTWCLQTMDSITLVAGTTFYSLPSDLIAIIQVDYRDGSNRVSELEEISEKALKQENPDYERANGKPGRYFVRYSTSQTAYFEIGFNPAPGSSSSTGTVRVQYYNQATDMGSSSNIPFDSYQVLYPYHYLITYGVVSKLKLIEGDSASAAAYQQMYQNGILLMKDRLGRMPNYSPSFSGSSK